MTPRLLTPVPADDDLRRLVAASTSGNRDAQEALARWCLPRVRRIVMLSCANPADADDLIQNVMALVLTKLDSFRGDASFFVWVDRITVNELRGHYRKQRFTLQRLRDYGAERATDAAPMRVSPDRQVQYRELIKRLAHHIGKLRPNQRLPVVLNVLHGYTVPEISALTDVDFEATKKRLQRGRSNLQRRLRRDPACRAVFEGV